MWFGYLFDRNEIGPDDAVETLTGPDRRGERVWSPEAWSQTLTMAPIWVATRVVGAVCAVNVSMVVSFAASAAAMALLVQVLTRRWWLAAAAGYLFAFSSLAVQKSTGHLAYLNQWPFPLLVLGLVWSIHQRRRGGAFLAATALGLAPWVDGYYLPFAWIAFAVIGIGLVAAGGRASWWPRLRSMVQVAAGAAIVQLPLVLLVTGLLGGTASPAGWAPTRPFTDALGEFDHYGARPGDFVTPDARSLFSGWLHPRSGVVEANPYVGLTVLALCVAGTILFTVRAVSRRRQARTAGEADGVGLGAPTDHEHDVTGRDDRLRLVTVATLSAVVVAYLCGPARPHLLHVELPNPFGVVAGLVPLWRVPSRMAVVVNCLAVTAAALTVAWLVSSIPRRVWRGVAAVMLLLFLGLDHVHPDRGAYRHFDYSQAPTAYRWLANLRDVDTIADYPLDDPNGTFSTFQPVHHKHTLNSKTASGMHTLEAAAGLADPQTAPLLRAWGVDMVVAHPLLRGGSGGGLNHHDFALVNRIGTDDPMPKETPAGRRQAQGLRDWYTTDVYRVKPGPTATGVLESRTGWYPLDVSDGRASRWASTRAPTVVATSFRGARTCRVHMTLTTFGPPREVRATQSGRRIWHGTIPEPTDVTFAGRCGVPITLHIGGPAIEPRDVDPHSTDPRRLALMVSRGRVASLR
ncbi:MAG: hypothetical protein R2698_01955 [Microthrixaceae bacterium]